MKQFPLSALLFCVGCLTVVVVVGVVGNSSTVPQVTECEVCRAWIDADFADELSYEQVRAVDLEVTDQMKWPMIYRTSTQSRVPLVGYSLTGIAGAHERYYLVHVVVRPDGDVGHWEVIHEVPENSE